MEGLKIGLTLDFGGCFFVQRNFAGKQFRPAPTRELIGRMMLHSPMPHTSANAETAAVVEICPPFAFHFVCGRSCNQA